MLKQTNSRSRLNAKYKRFWNITSWEGQI